MKTRHTEEQIIQALKEHQAGAPVSELCRRHGVSQATSSGVLSYTTLCTVTNWTVIPPGLLVSPVVGPGTVHKERTFDCPANAWQSGTNDIWVEYLPGPLYFTPTNSGTHITLPGSFTSTGTNAYLAKVDYSAEFCGVMTVTVGTVTINVYGHSDSDGDGLLDDWEVKYFGNLGQTATNDFDGDGVDNGTEYTNGTDPNKILFSVSVTNDYVNDPNAPLQLTITAGTPFYKAVLVDDTNFTAAAWTPYTSSNITVNLETNEGWHEVWIGLRGLPTNAVQTWEWQQINLDLTPPKLVITSPTNSVVTQPMIQLQGYSMEPLSSIYFDVTNAAGVWTNQQGFVTAQNFDTNQFDFTTNWFQCFDVPLTNGLNVITLHAADRAGNVTTTNLSFTLDYSSKTNPPLVQITWPQNGTQVSGTNFTLDGQLDDPTETVSASITDTNGDTNVVIGLVERNGKFWVQNLQLNSGTNSLTLTVKDAAGNTTATNISVIQSAFVLTMNPVTPDSQLWQKTVNLCF